MSARINEILENALNTGWTATLVTKTALTGLTCTVVASTKTVTRSAGSWITDGIAVGDIITFSGFSDAANNVAYTVSTVSALSLTGTTSAAMANETSGAGAVGADPLTKCVYTGKGMIDILKVNTAIITVTPKDNTTSLWSAISSAADLNCYCAPIAFSTSLKLTFSDDGNAWAFYKAAV